MCARKGESFQYSTIETFCYTVLGILPGSGSVVRVAPSSCRVKTTPKRQLFGAMKTLGNLKDWLQLMSVIFNLPLCLIKRIETVSERNHLHGC